MSERDDDHRPRDDGQRSVWDIPAQWARAWITIFSVLSAIGFIVAVLDQIYGWAITGAIIAVIIVMAVVFAVSAVSAFLMLRGVNVLIMLAHWLGQQTEKMRARQKAEGRAEGLAEGRAKGRAEGLEAGLEAGLAKRDADWQEWYELQVAKGATLDAPPPLPDDSQDKD